jgi:hypothetical protein
MRWYWLPAALGVGFTAGFLISKSGTRQPKGGPDSGPVILPEKKLATSRSSTTLQIVPLDWQSIESKDYKQYISNLRAIKCPELTIRDIIIADINALYEPREKAMKALLIANFWKATKAETSRNEFETRNKLIALRTEKRELIRELLGVDIPFQLNDSPASSYFESALSVIPIEKRAKVAFITEKYDLLMDQIKSRGDLSPADHQRLLALKQEKQNELASELNATELENFTIRVSGYAKEIRALVGFEPTEAEFAALVKQREEFESKYGTRVSYDSRDVAGIIKWQDARKQMDMDARGLLGDVRYEEYRRSIDPDYRSLYHMLETSGMDVQIANQTFAVKSDALKQKDAILKSGASAEEMQAALNQLRSRTERTVSSLIGQPDTFSTYQNEYGTWMTYLNHQKQDSKFR